MTATAQQDYARRWRDQRRQYIDGCPYCSGHGTVTHSVSWGHSTGWSHHETATCHYCGGTGDDPGEQAS